MKKKINNWKMLKNQPSSNSTSANIGDHVPEHMKQVFNQSKPPSSYTTQRAKK